MPSVMPETAGPIAAPATAVATWDSVTSQKLCERKTIPDAITVQMPGPRTGHLRQGYRARVKRWLGV